MPASNPQTLIVAPQIMIEKRDSRSLSRKQYNQVAAILRKCEELAADHPAATVLFVHESAYSNNVNGTVRHPCGDEQYNKSLFNAVCERLQARTASLPRGRLSMIW